VAAAALRTQTPTLRCALMIMPRWPSQARRTGNSLLHLTGLLIFPLGNLTFLSRVRPNRRPPQVQVRRSVRCALL
jgi:hypothetical protein